MYPTNIYYVHAAYMDIRSNTYATSNIDDVLAFIRLKLKEGFTIFYVSHYSNGVLLEQNQYYLPQNILETK